MKILIIKPSSLGDVIQALPVLRLLKKHYPASEIYWWVDARFASLLEGDPDLAGVIPFQRKGWVQPFYWRRLLKAIAWARAQKFDWVIDLQSLARTGMLAWLANGKQSIGMDEKREGARGFFDRVVRRPSFHTHAVDWYKQVLPQLGVPMTGDFQWLPERTAISSQIRKRAGHKPTVAIIPGARWNNKRWPAEHFASLLQAVAKRNPGMQFAILGSSEDKPLGNALERALGSERTLDLTGKSTLPGMVEWIRLSEWVVTNDTGPMHAAAAMGKPVVALCGPTEPRRTGPYLQEHHALQLDLPCAPCFSSKCRHTPRLECMQALRPELVLRNIERRGLLHALPNGD